MRLVEGGLLIAYGGCYGCRGRFLFDPELVPCLTDGAGVAQPICRYCVALANPIRIQRGLLPIVPLPGAYVDV